MTIGSRRFFFALRSVIDIRFSISVSFRYGPVRVPSGGRGKPSPLPGKSKLLAHGRFELAVVHGFAGGEDEVRVLTNGIAELFAGLDRVQDGGGDFLGLRAGAAREPICSSFPLSYQLAVRRPLIPRRSAD